jgi:hypothetical protein
VEEALQWWYHKKLGQLESEANLIREQLLQESFVMRRSLELSSIKSNEFVSPSRQQYVVQLENFHSSLKAISDRLFPPCINEGLPFALQYSVKKWREQFPGCQFKLDLPLNWRQKAQAPNFITLNIAEELLLVQIGESLTKNLIIIELKQNSLNHQLNNQLKITFVEQESNKQLLRNNQQELKYLQKSFECLTLGSCKNTLTKDSNIWSFKW